MEEANEFFKNGGTPGFDNADEMFAELEEESTALREAGKPKS